MALADRIRTDDDGREVIDTRPNRFVTVEAFVALFGNDWSYEALSQHPNADLGWKDLFPEWRAAGWFD